MEIDIEQFLKGRKCCQSSSFKLKQRFKRYKTEANLIKPMSKNTKHMSEQKLKMKIGKF
jgi:hypothetical protein